jgi:membrane protease YdiL (CAAX protease family)
VTIRLAAFVGIAFGYSWAWWLPLTASGRTVDFGEAAPAYLAGVPGPLVAAVVVTAATDGFAGLRDLGSRIVRFRWRWCAVALVVPVALLAVAVAITTVAGASPPSIAGFGLFPGLPATGVLAVWCYAVLWNGLGEETGWRGYLQPLLELRFSPLGATAIVSVVWAAWHLPVLPVLTSFAVLAAPAMLPMFWFGLACLSVVLGRLYRRSGASILVVALWHGTYNVVAGTAAAQHGINVVLTVCIMLWAVWTVVRELWVRRSVAAGT